MALKKGLLINRSTDDVFYPQTSYDMVEDAPTCLPANGGNADTVDGKHADDLLDYNNLTNKPSTYTPSAHTHSKSQITDMPSKLSAFDNDKNYQTEEQVKKLLSSLVNSAPETLDTLSELANALGNDPNFATTVTTLIGTKAPLTHKHTKAEITDFPLSMPANGGNADTVDGKRAADLQDFNNLTNKPSTYTPSAHTHSKSQITDMPSKLSAFDNDKNYQTSDQVKATVKTVDDKLKDQCNQNRIELTNSSYYPATVGYRSGQVVYLKCAGTLAKEVPANAGYVVALSMPAEYCPNVDIAAYPNISYAGKNIKVEISTTGKVTFTTPEKLPVGFGLNMHFTYMTGKSNF